MTADKPKSAGKTMIISLAVAVVLLAGLLLGAFAMSAGRQEEEDDDLIPLIACSEEDIYSVTIESLRDTYTISQDGIKDTILQWKIEGQDNTDVDLYSLKTIINRCYKLNARRELGTIDTANKELMAAYGFDNPTSTVTITYKDGVRTFVVGDAYGTEFYMYEKGTGKFYIAPTTVGTYFNLTSNELRTLPGLEVQTGNTGIIAIAKKGSPDISLAYIPSIMSDSRSWQMVSPVGGYTDSTTVTSLMSAISNFKMSLYVDSAIGDDMSKYGFDDPYASLVLAPPLVDEEDEESVAHLPSQAIFVGDPVREVEGYRYCYTYTVKDGESPDIPSCKVYAISDEVFDGIFGVKAIDLLDKQVILTNIDNVTEINLNIRGKESSIKISKKELLDDDGNPITDASGEKSYATFFDLDDGTRLLESCARAFYIKLISIKAVAFLRDDDPQEIGEKIFSVTMQTNIKIFGQEDTDLYAAVTAEVYELDSNYCVLRFRGQTENACKMKRSQILELFEAYELMLSGELPAIRED